MATKPQDFTSVIGGDAMQTYLDARKRANDAFEERQNRLIDPVYLAMAQGFLAPTKTGSFGESLGNVAAQVGPAQSAEDKRIMEMAKMRLDMATQGLSTEIQTKQAEMKQRLINEDLGVDSPYSKPPVAPQVAPQPSAQPAPPAPPVGALPSGNQPPAMPALPAQAPAQAPLSMAQTSPVRDAMPPPAPQAPAPMAQQGPAGTQLFPAQPEGFTPQEKLDYKRGLAAGKDPYEIRKDIMETRRKNIQVNQAGTSGVNLLTGQKFGKDVTPTKTFIHGFGSVEIPAYQAIALAEAKDADEYANIAKMIMLGPQSKAPAPSTPNATPTGAAPAGAPAQRPTTTQSEAEASQAKAEATKTGEGRAIRTNVVIDAVNAAESTRIIAQSAKDVINQPNSELFMGIFEKPKIKTALAKMVEDTVFAPTNFREAITSMNIALSVPRNPDENNKDYMARKQDVMDRYIESTTLMAQAKFAASLLSKGQGTITDGERKLFADTTINTKMSVNSFNKISDMLIERSKFAEDLGGKLARSRMQIDDFKQTPEYKKMASEYEGRLSSILRSGRPSASSSSGGRPDLDAAQANIERQVQ